MAFIPHVPEIEDFSDLLDILGSKTKFGERLQILNDTQAYLNKSLDRFKDVTDIENEKQRAAGLVADARQVKANADKYAADKRAEGDNYYAGKMAEIQNRASELDVRAAGVSAQAAALALKDAEADKKGEQAAQG